MLDMKPVATIVQNAINTAFPNGYPCNGNKVEDAKNWSNEQLEVLEKLYYEFESYDGLYSKPLSNIRR